MQQSVAPYTSLPVFIAAVIVMPCLSVLCYLLVGWKSKSTNKNRFVIQIQKALWRKLEPLFSRNKMLYASKTEVTENALALEGKSFGPDTKTTVNRYVCHDLSV